MPNSKRMLRDPSNAPVHAPARLAAPHAVDGSMESLIDLMGNPACILDGLGMLKHLNVAWRRLTGVGETHAAATWAQLISPEDCGMALSRFQALGPAPRPEAISNAGCAAAAARRAGSW